MALAFPFYSLLNAAVPLVLEYSGRVSSGGSPFTGSGSFRFAFVDSTASTTFWSNDGTSTVGSEPTAAVTVTVDDGFYSVYLGDDSMTNMTVIAESVFQNDDLYLRVWFD
ncbi:MAG: galactose oxidase, partial [Opitutae bacterium]|nr:galactose oxidase [Opitutae bacterium]